MHVFLTSAPAGGEGSSSRPGRFTPRERAPVTHWIGGWMGLRDSPDDVEKRTFLYLTRTRTPTPRSSSPQPVAIPTALSRFLGKIRSIEKFSHLIGNRTRDLPACSILPESCTLPRTPQICYRHT
jgi:hypothetical protein